MPQAAASGFPAPWRANRAMAVLALVGFVTAMDSTMTSILIEPMKHELGLSDVQIGLLQGTAFGLAYAAGSLPAGWLIDRTARNRLLMAGALIWSAGMAGTAFAHGMTLLVACRAALGLVAVLLQSGSISLVGDLYAPERRAVAASLFVVGQATGQAAGILLGGKLFDALVAVSTRHPGFLDGLTPWRALYLGAGVAALVLVPLLALAGEPARQEQGTADHSLRTTIRRAAAYRNFLVPLLAGLLFSVVAAQVIAVWSAPLLSRRFHLTPGQFSGWLSAIVLGSGIAGALCAGQLAEGGRRRAGRPGVLKPALLSALLGAPLMLFAIAPSVPALAVMLAAALVCNAIIPTIGAIAMTLNLPNEIRGLAIGANALLAALFGSATGPALVALISGAIGGERALGTAIALVCAPCMLFCAVGMAAAMRAGAARA